LDAFERSQYRTTINISDTILRILIQTANFKLSSPVLIETSSKKRPSIESIERQERNIAILWEDGHQSLFHHIWLRDNCTCPQCGDRSGGHRYLELGSIDPDIAPEKLSIDAAGSLQIRWQGDGHLSSYTPAWLSEHSYSSEAIAKRRQQPVLWDSTLNGKIPEWDYGQVLSDESMRLQMFQRINDYGFAIINAVPTLEDQIESLASIFGFIRETHYGRIFDLISTPQQRILAQTAHAIRPHNDELFRDPIPGLFMMHCLRASECGGGASILVDGFSAAQRLRSEHKDMFDLLCRVPIPHRRFLVDDVDDVALSAKWRSIELDRYGDIAAVHINERTMAPLDTEEHLVEPVYQALQQLLALVYAPEACVTYRLESGQAAVMDNHRVLHARAAFNGNRHIRQCHVDRDEFFSRLRALQRRLDIED
jgi:alpha-ketoglutarate-dependent taurine dioxygenase